MWEWILGIWTLGLVWLSLPWIFLVVFCFGAYSDYRDNGFFAGAWMIIAGFGAYMFISSVFSIPRIYLLYAALVYIPAGVIWSFYRFRCYVNDAVDDWNTNALAYRSNEGNASFFKHRITAVAQLSNITYWILFWPVSMVANLLSDLLRALESLVTTWFRRIYDGITNSAIKKMDVGTYEEPKE